ncbi:hypothetical protein ACM66B_002918 [Microbotryomycetes sp. NB124-2]
MRLRRPGLCACLTLVKSALALIITVPNATTVWDSNNVLQNTVEWALFPLTDPPPRSNEFTIWIRNGAPQMYSPALNTTIAQNVDFSNPSLTSFTVSDAPKFVPGPAYQLFLADPNDANTVYCESTVFSIEPIGTVPALSSSASLSSSQTSSSFAASSTFKSSKANGSTSRPTATGTAAGPRLSQSIPGGVGDQGHNLFPSNGGSRLGTWPSGSRLGRTVTGLVAMSSIFLFV